MFNFSKIILFILSSPTHMDNNQIWQAVLGEIELNLSKANFITWFKYTFLSSFENGKVVICVPNTFTRTWLEKKYHQKICTALKELSNQDVQEIIYKIETKKNANPAVVNKQITNFFPDKQKTNQNTNTINNSITPPSNSSGLNNRFIFDNFIVGKGNELAHAACQAVAANPGNAYNPLFIYGGVGLGKTHLLQAIGNELKKKSLKIIYATSERFSNDYIYAVRTGKAKEFKDRYRNVDLLLVDDVQFMGGKDGTQEEFFHTFNELHQTNRQIVITSDRPPKTIPAIESRLLSRFECGMVADVVQPDIETKVAILEKKCLEKNYALEDTISFYIANNIKNIRELEGALNKIIVTHEFNNITPTIDSVQTILNDLMVSTQSKSLKSKDVLEAVSNFYSVSVKDLLGKSRKKELAWPRQVAMYIIRAETEASYPLIGKELGGRDHTTILHACTKIDNEIKKNNNAKVKQEVDSVKQIINSSCV